MKKNVENEIEELLAQIENKYQYHNNASDTNFILSILKKLKILKLFTGILIITLSILLITNGVIAIEPLIIFCALFFIFLAGYKFLGKFNRPAKRWRGEVIEDDYISKSISQIIKSFFFKS